ncbi:glycerol kinase GlpK [Corynebacterium guangdongense]|uniref:ATP:glycerol 3-phosphotransferase n=1 Tax=Corynebacterium guangdongense TaxID=1783348 RepID=A0ABU1ZZV8_9CORY|nr:glycerol kinase GlpK [Corynebacterium guangdongense]MDR7330466.1 glycerol kinase [Corynebacterium guangdongense]
MTSRFPEPLIIAIDQGTTSTRCVITDGAGAVVSSAQYEHQQILPRQGWVEHDAREIWANVRRTVTVAMVEQDITVEDVGALGLTNQRETAVVWDRATGEPIHNAIVWQDTRTADDGDARRWLARTGLMANSYPAGPKIAWILDHVDGARERAADGELLCGTMDTWLLWNLTGGARGNPVYATDVTNASRTLLMDLRTQTWDPELCEAVGVPISMLPEIRASIGEFGSVRHRGLLAGVPITGVLGDQQAALFGQACFAVGDAKNTYGTGLFLLLNTGETPHLSESGLLTTVAWQVAGQAPVYALEGSVAVGGSLIQWLRDQLGVLRTAADSETLAGQVEDSGGVYIVPAFSGLFAPRWRPDARGTITGLTRFADRRHLARAALEATALQTREVVRAMEEDSGVALERLRVDGGMVANELLMQIQADVLGTPVERPANVETTVLGAGYAAAVGAGWATLDDIAARVTVDRTWESAMGEERRRALIDGWNIAVAASFGQA